MESLSLRYLLLPFSFGSNLLHANDYNNTEIEGFIRYR